MLLVDDSKQTQELDFKVVDIYKDQYRIITRFGSSAPFSKGGLRTGDMITTT